MKKLIFLLALCATIFGVSAFAQQHILTTPYYDNLSTHTTYAFTPLVWNNTTHAMEKADTANWKYFTPFMLYSRTGGYSLVYPGTNKTVAYMGIGSNKSGELALRDTSNGNYFRVIDTLSAWSINSHKAQEYKIRGKRLMRLDTNKVVTFDTAVSFAGTVTLSGSTVATTLSSTAFTLNSTPFRTGTGTPEGTITAPVGSIYIRTDGSTTLTVLYIKTSGTGNTGWTGH